MSVFTEDEGHEINFFDGVCDVMGLTPCENWDGRPLSPTESHSDRHRRRQDGPAQSDSLSSMESSRPSLLSSSTSFSDDLSADHMHAIGCSIPNLSSNTAKTRRGSFDPTVGCAMPSTKDVVGPLIACAKRRDNTKKFRVDQLQRQRIRELEQMNVALKSRVVELEKETNSDKLLHSGAVTSSEDSSNQQGHLKIDSHDVSLREASSLPISHFVITKEALSMTEKARPSYTEEKHVDNIIGKTSRSDGLLQEMEGLKKIVERQRYFKQELDDLRGRYCQVQTKNKSLEAEREILSSALKRLESKHRTVQRKLEVTEIRHRQEAKLSDLVDRDNVTKAIILDLKHELHNLKCEIAVERIVKRRYKYELEASRALQGKIDGQTADYPSLLRSEEIRVEELRREQHRLRQEHVAIARRFQTNVNSVANHYWNEEAALRDEIEALESQIVSLAQGLSDGAAVLQNLSAFEKRMASSNDLKVLLSDAANSELGNISESDDELSMGPVLHNKGEKTDSASALENSDVKSDASIVDDAMSSVTERPVQSCSSGEGSSAAFQARAAVNLFNGSPSADDLPLSAPSEDIDDHDTNTLPGWSTNAIEKSGNDSPSNVTLLARLSSPEHHMEVEPISAYEQSPNMGECEEEREEELKSSLERGKSMSKEVSYLEHDKLSNPDQDEGIIGIVDSVCFESKTIPPSVSTPVVSTRGRSTTEEHANEFLVAALKKPNLPEYSVDSVINVCETAYSVCAVIEVGDQQNPGCIETSSCDIDKPPANAKIGEPCSTQSIANPEADQSLTAKNVVTKQEYSSEVEYTPNEGHYDATEDPIDEPSFQEFKHHLKDSEEIDLSTREIVSTQESTHHRKDEASTSDMEEPWCDPGFSRNKANQFLAIKDAVTKHDHFGEVERGVGNGDEAEDRMNLPRFHVFNDHVEDDAERERLTREGGSTPVSPQHHTDETSTYDMDEPCSNPGIVNQEADKPTTTKVPQESDKVENRWDVSSGVAAQDRMCLPSSEDYFADNERFTRESGSTPDSALHDCGETSSLDMEEPHENPGIVQQEVEQSVTTKDTVTKPELRPDEGDHLCEVGGCDAEEDRMGVEEFKERLAGKVGTTPDSPHYYNDETATLGPWSNPATAEHEAYQSPSMKDADTTQVVEAWNVRNGDATDNQIDLPSCPAFIDHTKIDAESERLITEFESTNGTPQCHNPLSGCHNAMNVLSTAASILCGPELETESPQTLSDDDISRNPTVEQQLTDEKSVSGHRIDLQGVRDGCDDLLSIEDKFDARKASIPRDDFTNAVEFCEITDKDEKRKSTSALYVNSDCDSELKLFSNDDDEISPESILKRTFESYRTTGFRPGGRFDDGDVVNNNKDTDADASMAQSAIQTDVGTFPRLPCLEVLIAENNLSEEDTKPRLAVANGDPIDLERDANDLSKAEVDVDDHQNIETNPISEFFQDHAIAVVDSFSKGHGLRYSPKDETPIRGDIELTEYAIPLERGSEGYNDKEIMGNQSQQQLGGTEASIKPGESLSNLEKADGGFKELNSPDECSSERVQINSTTMAEQTITANSAPEESVANDSGDKVYSAGGMVQMSDCANESAADSLEKQAVDDEPIGGNNQLCGEGLLDTAFTSESWIVSEESIDGISTALKDGVESLRCENDPVQPFADSCSSRPDLLLVSPNDDISGWESDLITTRPLTNDLGKQSSQHQRIPEASQTPDLGDFWDLTRQFPSIIKSTNGDPLDFFSAPIHMLWGEERRPSRVAKVGLNEKNIHPGQLESTTSGLDRQAVPHANCGGQLQLTDEGNEPLNPGVRPDDVSTIDDSGAGYKPLTEESNEAPHQEDSDEVPNEAPHKNSESETLMKALDAVSQDGYLLLTDEPFESTMSTNVGHGCAREKDESDGRSTHQQSIHCKAMNENPMPSLEESTLGENPSHDDEVPFCGDVAEFRVMEDNKREQGSPTSDVESATWYSTDEPSVESSKGAVYFDSLNDLDTDQAANKWDDNDNAVQAESAADDDSLESLTQSAEAQKEPFEDKNWLGNVVKGIASLWL